MQVRLLPPCTVSPHMWPPCCSHVVYTGGWVRLTTTCATPQPAIGRGFCLVPGMCIHMPQQTTTCACTPNAPWHSSRRLIHDENASRQIQRRNSFPPSSHSAIFCSREEGRPTQLLTPCKIVSHVCGHHFSPTGGRHLSVIFRNFFCQL